MKPGWKEVRLGEVLIHDTSSLVKVEQDKAYPMVGVYSYGKGLFEKDKMLGMNTSYKDFYQLRPNQIVMSQLFGWEGAIAAVDEHFTDKYVSSMFPTFLADSSRSDTRFIFFFLQQPKVWKLLFERGKGMGSRRRTLNPESLLSLTIPLPPLAEQQRIVARLDVVKTKLAEIERLRAQQDKDVKALLFAHYTRLIENAEWLPMSDVAPITRRPVAIDPDHSYPELGIRSFGKGTFHKPPVNGIEVGTKKLFQIKANDLMFSNVFAWEGAIAVATSEDDERVGSHRFISCVADPVKALPGFLCYHLLTPKGMEAINAASPGGAGRNKTLGLEKLERITVPIPSLTSQAEFLALRSKLSQMHQLHARSAAQLAQLMPSLLAQAFGE